MERDASSFVLCHNYFGCLGPFLVSIPILRLFFLFDIFCKNTYIIRTTSPAALYLTAVNQTTHYQVNILSICMLIALIQNDFYQPLISRTLVSIQCLSQMPGIHLAFLDLQPASIFIYLTMCFIFWLYTCLLIYLDSKHIERSKCVPISTVSIIPRTMSLLLIVDLDIHLLL